MHPSIAIIALLCCACSAPRSVSEGLWQKRVHQRGWHIDLHRSSGGPASRERAGIDPLAMEPVDPSHAVASVGDRSIGWATPMPQASLSCQVRPVTSRTASVDTKGPIADPVIQQEDPENLMPRKELNPLAIPAFILGLGTIAAGLLTLDTWLVVILIALTITVAGISLARMRVRDQSGKGFALIGLMIGVFATILTAIAIAASGFE